MSMSLKSLHIPDMTCGHCKTSIEEALGQLGGIDSVVVDLETKAVKVRFEADSLTLDAIVETIENQGFDVVPA